MGRVRNLVDPITLRTATPHDAPAIAELSAQLGYPSSVAQTSERLARLLLSPADAIFVAEADGVVRGWVHAARVERLESGAFAEVTGLVVDSAVRGAGIGGQLMALAESWARREGLPKVRVRSRTSREAAHRFYEHLGYHPTKQQVVLDKPLTMEGQPD